MKDAAVAMHPDDDGHQAGVALPMCPGPRARQTHYVPAQMSLGATGNMSTGLACRGKHSVHSFGFA